MSQATPVEGWSELLLALPEFILTDAHVDDDELVADVELPGEVQPCTRCGVIDRHRVHDRRREGSANTGRGAGPFIRELIARVAHAVVELAISDLRAGAGLAHGHSGIFTANAAWLVATPLAHNLVRWTFPSDVRSQIDLLRQEPEALSVAEGTVEPCLRPAEVAGERGTLAGETSQ